MDGIEINKDAVLAKAKLYARKTTNTRCARMGRCDGCTVKYCDYKSRMETYMEAVEDIAVMVYVDAEQLVNSLVKKACCPTINANAIIKCKN